LGQAEIYSCEIIENKGEALWQGIEAELERLGQFLDTEIALILKS
jgi:hypothetical protein